MTAVRSASHTSLLILRHSPVPIQFTAYGDESDPGPMPIPATRRSKAIPIPALAIVTFWCSTTAIVGSTRWTVPILITTEAGTPIPPPYGIYNPTSSAPHLDIRRRSRTIDFRGAGPLRRSGQRPDQARHSASRLQNSRAAFVPPASHWAANSSNANAAPMGMRMRLKSSFDISSLLDHEPDHPDAP